MEINDEYILNNCFTKNGYPNPSKVKLIRNDANYIDVYNYLINRYSDSESMSETLFRIKYSIEIRPVCVICGKPVKHRGQQYYNKTCCQHCAKISEHNTVYGNLSEEEKKQKYKDIHNKIKETSLLKYGCESPNQFKEIKEKKKQSFINHFGVDNPLKCKEIQEKTFKTNIEKYGVKHPYQNAEIYNKYRVSCVKHFGVDHNFKSNEIREKAKQTFMEHYGKDTNIRKCSCSISKEEVKAKSLLEQYFEEIMHQYKCERYPWNCDFYIPKLDLFIECQFGIFHNRCKFIGSDEQLKELEKLKERSAKRKQLTGKNFSRYDAIIDGWTKADVEKRNKALKNNLNFLEVFSLNELEQWLSENFTKLQIDN